MGAFLGRRQTSPKVCKKSLANPNKSKRFYGRKIGRPLNESRQAALDAMTPVVGIAPEKLAEQESLAPASLFSKPFPSHWLEIGFGTGEHLSALARRHPDIGYIGSEPYINGMSAFMKDIARDYTTDNVRVLMDDALMIVNSLEDRCFDGIYILNPDPWHKTRHHKRRIVRPDTLDRYARVLKPGGELVLSTDVPYLADWMLTHTYNHPAFEWTATRADDWRIPPSDWVTTSYETKGAKGASKMSYLFFRKI